MIFFAALLFAFICILVVWDCANWFIDLAVKH